MIAINETVVVRGGGDIASGTIHRLHRCGFRVAVLELPGPRVVRRTVSFAQAVYDGEIVIEGVKAVKTFSSGEAAAVCTRGVIPVLVDPEAAFVGDFCPYAVVDATLAKKKTGTCRSMAPITVALGPGFEAGRDVDVVVETLEGHNLGKIILSGCAAPDTGLSVPLLGYDRERVLRSPCGGVVRHRMSIGDAVAAGDIIAWVHDVPVVAEIGGVIHGLIQEGITVDQGLKLGDIDPRGVKSYCYTIFDKARAIAGGVVEAILHMNSLRNCKKREGA